MGKTDGTTPFDQKLFLVFIVTFATMTVFEFTSQFLYPYTPDWRSNIITSLFASGLAVILAYFHFSSYFTQNNLLREETERRNSLEDAVREREKHLTTIFNAAQVGIVLVDAESHTILQANPMALALLRAPDSEITGEACRAFIQQPAGRGSYPGASNNQPGDSPEKILVAKDGTRVPVLMTTVPAELGDRKVLVVSFVDITDRKKSELALKASEERYRILTENMKDVVWQMDTGMRFSYVSPSIFPQSGYTADEVTGKTLFDFITPESAETIRSQIAKKYEQVAGGAPLSSATYQFEMVCRDGRHLPIEAVVNPITGPDGYFAGWNGVSRDISMRKQAEDALIQANRKLNLLSSITRHDINNQISGLSMYLELSKKDADASRISELIRKEEEVVRAIQRQIEFTRYYQDIGLNLPKWQDVSGVIRTAIRELKIPEGDLLISIPDIEIFADPLLEKVFYNLMENSLRHGDRVSRMSFSSEETTAGLLLRYEDDGIGITEEERQNLFQKGFGKNTGLGLFLSREILSITGISITENSEPGSGVRFEITVPAGQFRAPNP